MTSSPIIHSWCTEGQRLLFDIQYMDYLIKYQYVKMDNNGHYYFVMVVSIDKFTSDR